MQSATHINDLPNDVLAKILWHCEENTSWLSDSDALWSRHLLWPKPQYLRSIPIDEDSSPEEETTLIPTPSAVPSAAKIALLSSVCRRWRALAKRDVSTLLVERNRVISLQELSHAVARFPNLTHLHLCDGSVETLDDNFLSHLASSCPNLRILHVGSEITHDPGYAGWKHQHPITEAGLDRFFKQCSQLEQLSLLCLHLDVELPPSFFHLTRLHTLALTTASALEDPDLESLTALTTLHIASVELSIEQLSNVRRLPSITTLSVSTRTSFYPDDPGSAEFTIAQLPLIKSALITSQMLLPSWPCTTLEQLELSGCRELERLPDDIAELLPRLRELTICSCELLQELPEGFTSLNRLESLSIYSCLEFRCLPENVGRLSALKTLVLEKLPLSSLPDSLCQLSALETFFLLWCEPIHELPAGFGCLTALKTLCLGRVALPVDIGRLCNLQTLLVRESSHQRHLPSSLTEISSLTRLELELCHVEALPEGVGELSNLRELHVSCCSHLTALPASVTCLTRLETLTLSGCRELAFVPTGLDGLTRLKQLVVTWCDALKHPPQVLPASLEVLSWGSFSHAMALPDLSRLTGLRTLCLNRVSVACGKAVSRSLSHLEHLRLTLANDAEELPFALTFLSRLRTLIVQGAGHVQRLPPDMGTVLPQLRKLKLCADELRELPASVTALENLTSLEVHYASQLASLPDGIGALCRLRQLQLLFCEQLEQLPASLTCLTCLNELAIPHSSIRSLCPNFARLTRLKSLCLSGCAKLQALPGEMSELKALRRLDLHESHHFQPLLILSSPPSLPFPLLPSSTPLHL
ncbi:unnamed protein product [Closterium sp. Naga37s-1]|nr:unnamed protein product [Closterium sp. Naga37s-1]